MAIEIVSFPIQNGDFPVRYVAVYQRVNPLWSVISWSHIISNSNSQRENERPKDFQQTVEFPRSWHGIREKDISSSKMLTFWEAHFLLGTPFSYQIQEN